MDGGNSFIFPLPVVFLEGIGVSEVVPERSQDAVARAAFVRDRDRDRDRDRQRGTAP